MPCYHPLTAYRTFKDATLNGSGIVFDSAKAIPRNQEPMQLPCSQCVGCRLDRARKWAIRCLHEASLYDRNCFITLTYNEDTINPAWSLVKQDFVLFMKRLRKKYGPDIRFFQCGEYGEELQRPHHHAILFNHDFDDREVFSKRGDIYLYTSQELSKLWPHGFSTIGDVTFDSVCYVARYIMKKRNGKDKDKHYDGREQEYVTMSRRPGIGYQWFVKYKSDLYNHDKCVVKHNFVVKPPRYYDKLYDEIKPEHLKSLKKERVAKAKSNKDNTLERLEVREEVQRLNLQRLERSYEKKQR